MVGTVERKVVAVSPGRHSHPDSSLWKFKNWQGAYSAICQKQQKKGEPLSRKAKAQLRIELRRAFASGAIGTLLMSLLSPVPAIAKEKPPVVIVEDAKEDDSHDSEEEDSLPSVTDPVSTTSYSSDSEGRSGGREEVGVEQDFERLEKKAAKAIERYEKAVEKAEDGMAPASKLVPGTGGTKSRKATRSTSARSQGTNESRKPSRAERRAAERVQRAQQRNRSSQSTAKKGDRARVQGTKQPSRRQSHARPTLSSVSSGNTSGSDKALASAPKRVTRSCANCGKVQSVITDHNARLAALQARFQKARGQWRWLKVDASVGDCCLWDYATAYLGDDASVREIWNWIHRVHRKNKRRGTMESDVNLIINGKDLLLPAIPTKRGIAVASR